jgi:hypothetical protein
MEERAQLALSQKHSLATADKHYGDCQPAFIPAALEHHTNPPPFADKSSARDKVAKAAAFTFELFQVC